MEYIQASNTQGAASNCALDRHPNECPHCHRSISPLYKFAFIINVGLRIVYQCPDSRCKEIFIAYFEGQGGGYDLKNTSIGTVKGKTFSEHIIGISPSFVEIYNQALKAEEFGLNLICGIGYRKALEFLIKDYLINLKPQKEGEIKNKFLGNCIQDYVESSNLKDMAERAVWLGNDETHYTRKWDGKDVGDLKSLIEVSIHWIEIEFITKKYKGEMPNSALKNQKKT